MLLVGGHGAMTRLKFATVMPGPGRMVLSNLHASSTSIRAGSKACIGRAQAFTWDRAGTGLRGMMETAQRLRSTATHGGADRAEVRGGRFSALQPIAMDYDGAPVCRRDG